MTKIIRLLIAAAMIFGAVQGVRFVERWYRDDEAHTYAASIANESMRRVTLVEPDEQPPFNSADSGTIGQRFASVDRRADGIVAVAWLPKESRCNMVVLAPGVDGEWDRLFLDRRPTEGEADCTAERAFARFDAQPAQ